MNQDEAKYYRNRGLCYENIKRKGLAKKDYEKSLEFEPYDVRAHFYLGKVLSRMKNYEEAADHLQKGKYTCFKIFTYITPFMHKLNIVTL